MNKLFIDTHSEVITLGLLIDNTCTKKEIKSFKNGTEIIMPLLKELFDESKIDIENIDEVIVVNGPGSFTGTRIGLTIAKTIAYVLEKDIKTVSSLVCYLVSDESKCKMALIPDGKSYFLAYTDDNCETYNEIYVSKIDEYQSKYELVSNKIDLERIFAYSETIQTKNVHSVRANYIKKIGVEE